jgi:hypothetical protein
VLLLAAAAVFLFFVLNDEAPDDGNTIAASQTEVIRDRATVSAKETIVAQAEAANESPVSDDTETESSAAATTAPDGANADQPAESTTTPDQDDDPAAVAPTPAPGNTSDTGGDTSASGLSAEEMQSLLPDPETVPDGLDGVEDVTRSLAEVVTALGGTREVEALLSDWGWTANVERKFEASSPDTLSSDATTLITVSLHGFADEAAASEALTFYADVVAESGYEEAEAGDIGTANRLLVQSQVDGGTIVALYVQQGSVLYRVGGYSPTGDPTTNILNVAESMLAQ